MSKTRIAATLSFTFFSVFALSAFAQGTDYVMLAPVPGLTKPGSEGLTNTATFLPAFFKMVIGLASALAVVMLLYGGIQYMTTDAWNKKDSAKETIKDALVGLLLTLSAYLIIYTINPKMLSFNLEIPQLEIPRSGLSVGDTDGVGDGETGGGTRRTGGTGTPMTPAEIIADTNVRNRLQNAGVSINAGPCTQGQTRGCTNLNGLPEGAIQALITLKDDCDCGVRVTGGTESGHRTHGVGQPIVDLGDDSTLRSWLSRRGFLVNNGTGAVVNLSSGRRANFVFERAGQDNSTGNHWHVVM